MIGTPETGHLFALHNRGFLYYSNGMSTTPRRPGRPATGQTPTRSIRIGDVWDDARRVAGQRGETITDVITSALEEYVMSTTTELPPLSDGTKAAIANVVDYKIEREHGQDTADAEQGARMIALAGLQFDLLAAGADAERVRGLAETTLRILVREGLAARVCQCRQLHPHGCPHGSAVGSLWCGGHYEADVPPIDGALLCGACHVAEYQARS